MPAKKVFFIVSFFIATTSIAQKPVTDSFSVDTSFTDYDLLFNELDAFLDSITAPRSFTLFNLGISNGYFSYRSVDILEIETIKKLNLTPSLAYFDKSGFGISAEASIADYGNRLNAYQYSFTGSYDFMKKNRFITGVSFTHFLTKSDLPFYTSPLKNEIFAYFTYKKHWLKPSIGISYGWGSREDFEDREEKINAIQLAQRGFTRTSTRESINDFNLISSVRHDFYWLDIFSKKDYIRLTPQLSFSSGTHQFGFNQTSNTYATVRRTGSSVLYSTENISLDNNLYFQPLSLSAFLKTEYSIGKFFIQPQLVFDYYFPASQNNFSTTWLLHAGLIF
jgi:hypothetical protein